jgi:hypothetical protein
MTPEQFTYWLQGYFEISNATELNKEQTKVIKDHLSLLFDKVTPIYTNKPFEGLVKYTGISCSVTFKDVNDPPKIGFLA